MPFVNVRTARGLLSQEQVRTLQHRITDLMVEVEGGGDPAFRNLVWVLIEEHEPRAWALGGQPLDEGEISRLGR